MIPCKDVTAITKEKTARVIPNAIQITTDKASYFFTSFGARDKTYMMLFRIWQNALLDQVGQGHKDEIIKIIPVGEMLVAVEVRVTSLNTGQSNMICR